MWEAGAASTAQATPAARLSGTGVGGLPEERIVSGMALLRMLSAAIELTAAVLMVRSGRVAEAMRINGLLGLVGPLVLASVTALGLVGLAGRLSPVRMGMLAVAVALVLASLYRQP